MKGVPLKANCPGYLWPALAGKIVMCSQGCFGPFPTGDNDALAEAIRHVARSENTGSAG